MMEKKSDTVEAAESESLAKALKMIDGVSPTPKFDAAALEKFCTMFHNMGWSAGAHWGFRAAALHAAVIVSDLGDPGLGMEILLRLEGIQQDAEEA